MQENSQIPKIIHYCWFGDNEPSPLMKKCFESWKKFLPDYEIRIWNNDSIKDIESPFLKGAVEHKKWAFASDYVRLYALYNFGGIYFDTDVEVLKSFDDMLNHNFFIGVEECTKNPSIGTATIGCKKGNFILADLLKEYDSNGFLKPNGRFDTTPNPKKFLKYFKKKFNISLKYGSDEIIDLGDNMILYPKSYFSPKNNIKENSYSIHHYASSWSEDWAVRTWINSKSFAFHLLKRQGQNYTLPLLKDEELTFLFKVSKNKYFAFVKKHKKLSDNKSLLQYIVDVLRGKDFNIREEKFKKFCKKNNIELKNNTSFKQSDKEIEIVIPCIDKDSGVLPLVIESARKYLLHPIKNIKIIAPSNSVRIKEICEEKNCVFVNEKDILIKGNYSGWLYQQFLKLSYHNFSETDNYLILDADTIINNPLAFIEDNKFLLEYSDEFHKPYFRTLKWLKIKTKDNMSFVAHHMLFNKYKMKELLDYIEKQSSSSWINHLLKVQPKHPKYNISEYEIYSHFMLQNYKDEVIVDYFMNKGFSTQEYKNIYKLAEENKEYRTLSFHNYCYSSNAKEDTVE